MQFPTASGVRTCPANMVLEDSDVEMIVAEIEVSVSKKNGRDFFFRLSFQRLPCGLSSYEFEVNVGRNR